MSDMDATAGSDMGTNATTVTNTGNSNVEGVNYPSRVVELLNRNGNRLPVEINDAYNTNDYHQLQGYVVYFIQFGQLVVKRRYSEFESLRNCLVKLFPTLIIPPIPEKQSLKSNLVNATSTLGLSTSSITAGHLLNAHSEDLGNGNSDMDEIHYDPSSVHHNQGTSSKDAMESLITYRKRMLAAFLNRCFQLDHIVKNRFFIYFLDPEVNYSDYVTSKENGALHRTNIFQLSPTKPLDNLENQLYLTLPVPSITELHMFKELEEEDQFKKIVDYETKFMKYEMVLSNISKINKRMIRHINELSMELSELGSTYNQLSLIQNSNDIEFLGKLFERHKILLTSFTNSVNIGFLDKLVELKHFSGVCKELLEYNRKKMIQLKMVEKDLYSIRSKYKRYEDEEKRIRGIDQKMDNALRRSGYAETDYIETPISDQELQTALFSKTESRKGVYGKIPGVNKLNSMILKYVKDPNPDETRRAKFYDTKVRLYQLEAQFHLLQSDLNFVNDDITKNLAAFHEWFKKELCVVTMAHEKYIQDLFVQGQEPWQELKESL